MDKFDFMYKRKQFFMTLYEPVLGEHNTLIDNQQIRIFQKNDTFSKVSFFNNIDDLNEFIESHKFGVNTYFTLSTTDNESGSEEHLQSRTCIAFDFDKKDFDKLDTKDIIFFFKKIGLWFHALISSGNGFHVYMFIEKTNDMEKVLEVTKAIGQKLGADEKAMLSTQILRVPLSFNIKEDKSKQINIIQLFEKSTIKRYNINKLYNQFCRDTKDIGNKNTEFVLNNHNILPCVKSILENGSTLGERNSSLQKIVVTMKRMNKSFNDTLYLCKEWNNKCIPIMSGHELDYQVKYMYESLDRCNYDCKDCEHKSNCFSTIESDFVFDQNEEMISIEYKIAKKLKYSNRSEIMGGNELLILNILKHFNKELSMSDILKHLTYKDKCRLSEKTIRETLKFLEDTKYISKYKGIKKLGLPDKYKFNHINSSMDTIFSMSYFPTLICIYGIITTDELRLYTHMRYKNDISNKENKSNGNIFRINQEELAKDLNTTQARISIMINNLIESKILEIWETKRTDRGFYYYVYRLVR